MRDNVDVKMSKTVQSLAYAYIWTPARRYDYTSLQAGAHLAYVGTTT